MATIQNRCVSLNKIVCKHKPNITLNVYFQNIQLIGRWLFMAKLQSFYLTDFGLKWVTGK